MKKSDEKKTKLVDAIINLIDQNKKVSVHAVAKESKTPYGTFYYYFKNLDDAHSEAIQKIMMRGITWIDAEPGKNQSLEGKSNIFKIYFSWFLVINAFKDQKIATWLRDHPSKINKLLSMGQPATKLWAKQAIKLKEESMFTGKNLKHFEMARPYFTWTIQNALSELQKDRTAIEVYKELMKVINVLDLPLKIHKKYVQKVINFTE
ncbi:TetR/AcrR family transcriptional regulator [bacterium]|nr:TetR/AcrR family transcriptional regulator [bacterium]